MAFLGWAADSVLLTGFEHWAFVEFLNFLFLKMIHQ